MSLVNLGIGSSPFAAPNSRSTPNSAIRCFLLYFQQTPALPFPMVAPVPAHISKPPRRKLSCPSRRSGPNSRPAVSATTHCPLLLTPLLPITSLQPQQFHAITHSFAQRHAAIPRPSKNLHTLSIATGVYPQRPPHSVPSVLRFSQSSGSQVSQLLCLHRLGASLSSLCPLFCIRFLCFQSFAATNPNTPGCGIRRSPWRTPGVGG
jgi:hypothetical protein